MAGHKLSGAAIATMSSVVILYVAIKSPLKYKWAEENRMNPKSDLEFRKSAQEWLNKNQNLPKDIKLGTSTSNGFETFWQILSWPIRAPFIAYDTVSGAFTPINNSKQSISNGNSNDE
ncbi:uncharacterized protein KGF55_001820 [Candida pseudojiufengensis]|uniref:uncharacterized protein n=1 Tax=Candida pseudojiufengensis TaxID=497109 RepID=UPI0022240004|nr:uncharacterized protein KGF55_001820 [Candida pseudojiufengensis]KAI5964750.1 hypothetical protein KGF55_001820 [Candida pseudojiufengensis]